MKEYKPVIVLGIFSVIMASMPFIIGYVFNIGVIL